MALYNFERLIEKYGVDCKLVRFGEGYWLAGKYHDGEKIETDINGAVVPITESRVQNSGGSFKQGDCEFITTKPIEFIGAMYLVHNDKKYKLEQSTNYSDYADFNTYVARRVSAFDTTGSGKTESNA